MKKIIFALLLVLSSLALAVPGVDELQDMHRTHGGGGGGNWFTIGLAHAIPIGVAWGFGGRGLITLVAAVTVVVALFTGKISYFLVDLAFIVVAYVLAMKHVQR